MQKTLAWLLEKSPLMTKAKLRKWLLHQMPGDSVCAEIGVFRGDFSQQILDITNPRRLHLIDPWRYQAKYEKSPWLKEGQKNQVYIDGLFAHVRDRFQKEIENNKVVVHREFSHQAVTRFQDNYFDWIYVDGDHTYEYVMKDLNAFATKIKEGGHIAGDDYCRGRWWKGGVQKAVDKFIRCGLVKSHVIRGSQFILQITHNA